MNDGHVQLRVDIGTVLVKDCYYDVWRFYCMLQLNERNTYNTLLLTAESDKNTRHVRSPPLIGFNIFEMHFGLKLFSYCTKVPTNTNFGPAPELAETNRWLRLRKCIFYRENTITWNFVSVFVQLIFRFSVVNYFNLSARLIAEFRVHSCHLFVYILQTNIKYMMTINILQSLYTFIKKLLVVKVFSSQIRFQL